VSTAVAMAMMDIGAMVHGIAAISSMKQIAAQRARRPELSPVAVNG